MDLDVSDHYRDKSDHVSFSYHDKAGKKVGRVNGACYAQLTPHPGEFEILVLPSNHGGYVTATVPIPPAFGPTSSAHPLRFQQFFRRLKEYGIIPQEVQIGVGSSPTHMIIPKGDWGYHTFFVTLSMYRHADNHGKSILGRTMLAYDKLRAQGVHFLQCLHWAFLNTQYGSHHSCISLSAVKNPHDTPVYGPNTDAYGKDLRYGLALALYGQLSIEERDKLTSSSSSVNMFINLAKNLKTVEIGGVDEVLDPKYATFYEDPKQLLVEKENESLPRRREELSSGVDPS